MMSSFRRSLVNTTMLVTLEAERCGLQDERFDVGADKLRHPASGIEMEMSDTDWCTTNADFITNRVNPFLKQIQKWRQGGKHDVTAVAVKHDDNKLPWPLLPWDAVRAILMVMAFGAKKYAPRNWERGFDWDRLFRATIEHMTAWWDGESKDPETGYSHLAHAGCCILFLIAHEIRGIGKDTRPNA